jgi:hypothetical protein
MVPVDGSAGNAVAGLGCGVTECRRAAVNSATAVRGCFRVQQWWDEEGKVSTGAWRVKAIRAYCMVGTWRQQRHAAPASEACWRGLKNAGSARCRTARGRKTPGRSESDSVGTVALGRAQFGAQCCFSNYSYFVQNSKYKTKTIPMLKIIETWYGVRDDYSKQLLRLGPLPILNRIQVIKLGTTSTLNFSLNF